MVGFVIWVVLRGFVIFILIFVFNFGILINGIVLSVLVEFVKSYEGFSVILYYDSVGVRIIGYGSIYGWIMNRFFVIVVEVI